MSPKQSLQKRMIRLMIVVAVLPLLLLMTLVSVLSWRSDVELMDKQCESVLDAIEADILLQKNRTESVIRSLADSEAVRNMLTSATQAEWATRFNEGVYSEITRTESYLAEQQASVTLIYNSSAGLECWPMLLEDSRFTEETALAAFMDSQEKDKWTGIGVMIPPSLSHIELYQSIGEKLIYYCRVTTGYRKQLGVIKCGLALPRLLRSANIQGSGHEIWVTAGERIIHASGETPLPEKLAEGITATMSERWHRRVIETLGLSICMRIGLDDIWAVYWRSTGIFVLLALLAVLIMLAAASSVLGSVVQRLRRLEQLCNSIGTGEGIRLPDEGTDEVGGVVRAFGNLFSRIENKNAELLQKERDKRHSQLQALQYQLNPHFLFNSLHWLQLRLEEREIDTETSESISRLGSVLRYNLSESLEATLAQEADQLRAYTGFMSEMKEQPIDLCLSWPDNLNDIKVLRFVLQPLVENALRHGLIRGQGMQITVSAEKADGWLTIRVQNNGRCIDPETLGRIQTVFSTKASDTSAGIGLNNLVYRLSLRYGKRYSLQVTSDSRKTAFIIRLPESDESLQEGGETHALPGGRR